MSCVVYSYNPATADSSPHSTPPATSGTPSPHASSFTSPSLSDIGEEDAIGAQGNGLGGLLHVLDHLEMVIELSSPGMLTPPSPGHLAPPNSLASGVLGLFGEQQQEQVVTPDEVTDDILAAAATSDETLVGMPTFVPVNTPASSAASQLSLPTIPEDGFELSPGRRWDDGEESSGSLFSVESTETLYDGTY
jgi:hypothetical protein